MSGSRSDLRAQQRVEHLRGHALGVRERRVEAARAAFDEVRHPGIYAARRSAKRSAGLWAEHAEVSRRAARAPSSPRKRPCQAAAARQLVEAHVVHGGEVDGLLEPDAAGALPALERRRGRSRRRARAAGRRPPARRARRARARSRSAALMRSCAAARAISVSVPARGGSRRAGSLALAPRPRGACVLVDRRPPHLRGSLRVVWKVFPVDAPGATSLDRGNSREAPGGAGARRGRRRARPAAGCRCPAAPSPRRARPDQRDADRQAAARADPRRAARRPGSPSSPSSA